MKDPDIISDTRETQQQLNNSEKMKQQNTQNSSALLVTSTNKNEIPKEITTKFTSKNVHVLKCNNQIKELHTVLRDRFYFYKYQIIFYFFLTRF